ncbi:MAG: hypothetical protein JXB17_06445 [Bacteroidales bacterium]|nr:hypothetical protein [Bacteroidales bacterium]
MNRILIFFISNILFFSFSNAQSKVDSTLYFVIDSNQTYTDSNITDSSFVLNELNLQIDSNIYITENQKTYSNQVIYEIISDTTGRYDEPFKTALSKLLQYLSCKDIRLIIDTINYYLDFREDMFAETDTTEISDSISLLKKDSIINELKKIIHYAKDDSTKLFITNNSNDSLEVWLKENSTYTHRFRLLMKQGILPGYMLKQITTIILNCL